VTRRTFDNGTLLEEWDDTALVHGALVDGAWVTRIYTDEEAAAVTPTPAPLDEVDRLTADILVLL
jgi:hypothetical protein